MIVAVILVIALAGLCHWMVWPSLTWSRLPEPPAPEPLEADSQELAQLVAWDDAFNEVYDWTDPEATIEDALKAADAAHPPLRSSITLPGGKTKFYVATGRCHVCETITDDGDVCKQCYEMMMSKQRPGLADWNAKTQSFDTAERTFG